MSSAAGPGRIIPIPAWHSAVATRVLFIGGTSTEAELVRHALSASGVSILLHADRLGAGLELLEARGADVALLDLDLPDSQGLPTFLRLHTYAPRLPVVVRCRPGGEQVGHWALEAGARDYLIAGQTEGAALGWALRYALDYARWLAHEEAARAAAEATLRDLADHGLRCDLRPALVSFTDAQLVYAQWAGMLRDADAEVRRRARVALTPSPT